MAAQILLILSYAVATVLFVILVWGVPTYFISRELTVSAKERKLWIAANIVFPWLAFFAFMLVAPISEARSG